MDKVVASFADAVSDIGCGDTIGIAGFGVIHGFPVQLIAAVRARPLTGLTIVCNSLGRDAAHPVSLVAAGQARKLVAAFSARAGGVAGSAAALSPVPLEIEMVPQGVLVERLRAVSAGIGAFYSQVAEDTVISAGKERREIGGRVHVLETPLHLHYALIYAHRADRAGNVSFRGTSQNFGPSFAKGARTVIVEVDELAEVGEIDPADVDLPGIFVDRVVVKERKADPLWRIPREAAEARAYLGRPGRTATQMAQRIAALLPDGGYVNLGVGLPTMVSDHLAGRDVVLHAENGVLGYGTRLSPGDADPDYYNAGAEPVSLQPGASVFDSTEAFEIARSGRLTAVVLGAFQVDQHGTFANWTTPAMGGGAIGGAMDLLVAPGKLIIAMWHCERSGQPKIVGACQYDVTGTGCVDFIVTDLAVIERDGRGLVLRECAPGFEAADVVKLTEAPLTVDLWDVPVMIPVRSAL
ncbi:MAG TPA: 3-oxoacid CoA-transferase subunit A [Trebonia sp.]|nr:3-oxoacid CoA-transferase subunit A [Trebonia sp.]